MELPYVSEIEIVSLLKKRNLFTNNIDRAITLANQAHRGQFRDSGKPYINEHVFPIIVQILSRDLRGDIDLERLLLDGILHDVIEDSDISPVEIRSQFGKSVEEDVKALSKTTEENSVTTQEASKQSNISHVARLMRSSEYAKVIKLEDRIQNLSCIVNENFHKKPEKYIRYAQESYSTYSPLARLPIFGIDYDRLLYEAQHRVAKLASEYQKTLR